MTLLYSHVFTAAPRRPDTSISDKKTPLRATGRLFTRAGKLKLSLVKSTLVIADFSQRELVRSRERVTTPHVPQEINGGFFSPTFSFSECHYDE